MKVFVDTNIFDGIPVYILLGAAYCLSYHGAKRPAITVGVKASEGPGRNDVILTGFEAIDELSGPLPVLHFQKQASALNPCSLYLHKP